MVFAVQQARTGRVVAGGTDTLKLPETRQNEAASVGGICRVQFEVSPGDYIARVVVREPGGLVGSADRRFDVRDLEGPDLTASDLVVGSLLDPVPVRLRTTAADVLTGTLEIYGRTVEQLRDIDVRVELSSIGGNAPVMVAEVDLLDAQQDDRGATRVALIPCRSRTSRRAAMPSGRRSGRRHNPFGNDARGRDHDGSTADHHRARLQHGSFEPEALLNGDVVRRYLDTVRRAAPTLARAVDFAAAGSWNRSRGGRRAPTPRPLACAAWLGSRAAITTRRRRCSPPRSNMTKRSAALAFFLGWAHSVARGPAQAISAWRRTDVRRRDAGFGAPRPG